MKKLLLALCALTVLSAPAFAASDGEVYFGSDLTGTVGDTVYVDFKMEVATNDTIDGFRMFVDYDTAKLEAVSFETHSNAPGTNWFESVNYSPSAGGAFELVFLSVNALDSFGVWEGEFARVGFEILAAGKATIEVVGYYSPGFFSELDTTTWGQGSCSGASKPWIYAGYTPTEDCEEALIHTDKISITGSDLMKAAVSEAQWSAVKELYK